MVCTLLTSTKVLDHTLDGRALQKVLESFTTAWTFLFSQFWKPGIQGWGVGGFGFSQGFSLLGLQMATSSLCPHVVLSLRRTPVSHTRVGPQPDGLLLMQSSLQWTPLSNMVTFWGPWGLGLQHLNGVGGDTYFILKQPSWASLISRYCRVTHNWREMQREDGQKGRSWGTSVPGSECWDTRRRGEKRWGKAETGKKDPTLQSPVRGPSEHVPVPCSEFLLWPQSSFCIRLRDVFFNETCWLGLWRQLPVSSTAL